MNKNKKFYYPYCGWRKGFCLSENGCSPPEDTSHFACIYFRWKHPITKQRPQLR